QLLVDMEHARREAEVASRVKDEFLATLSHELRTPLGAILLWASLLRGAKLDEATTARALEMIEQDAKALERIVGDILDVSRIVTGKLGLQVGAVALAPTIEAANEALRPGASGSDWRSSVIWWSCTEAPSTRTARARGVGRRSPSGSRCWRSDRWRRLGRRRHLQAGGLPPARPP